MNTTEDHMKEFKKAVLHYFRSCRDFPHGNQKKPDGASYQLDEWTSGRVHVQAEREFKAGQHSKEP